MGLIQFALIIMGVYVFALSFDVIKGKYDKIKKEQALIALIVVVGVPLMLFLYVMPNFIPEGELDVVTTVETNSGKEYQEVVTFEIQSNMDTYENYDNTHTYYYRSFRPVRINWSNGGVSEAWDTESGIEGDKIRFIDQNDKEYYVTAKEPEISLYTRLTAYSKLDLLIDIISLFGGILVMVGYIKKNEK